MNKRKGVFPYMELFKLLGTIAINNTDANNAIDETTGNAEKSESKMVSAFKKIGAAVATYFAVDKIVAFGKSVVDTTSSFEDGMLKVQSLSGATQEEYKKLSDAALNYGSTTAWTAKDVSDAMGYMALAGFNTNEILESTSGMLSLASASGEDLATVTDILTDSMTGFGDGADQASRYADVLATTQAKSNTTVGALGEAFTYVSSLAGTYKYSLEDVSAALGTMANAGVKGSMAGTSLSSIITRLGTNTSNARDAIEALGVSFYNQDGTARALGDVITDLCDATAGMDVAQKAELASTVAGAEAQKGLLAILNQGSSAYTDLQEKLNNCSGAASDMANNMESGLGGSIRSLESAWEGFKIKIGEKIEPGVNAGLTTLTNFISSTALPAFENLCSRISNIVDWMKKNETSIKAVASALAVATSAIVAFKAGAMIQSVVNAFQEAQIAISLFSLSTNGATVAQGLLNGSLTLGEAIVGILTGKMTLAELAQIGMTKAQAALNAVMTANPIGLVIAAIAALIAVGVLLYKNWDTVKEKLSELWGHIKDIWEKIRSTISEKVDGIKEKVTNIFDSVKDTVKNVWETIKNIITVALMFIGEIISAYFQIITLPWRFIWENCKEYIFAAWEAIKNVVSEALDAILSVISNVWNSIVEFLTPILEGIRNTFTTIWEGIQAVIETAVNTIQMVILTVWNAIVSFLKPILEGIKNTFSTVWNGIKTIVSNVINGVKTVISNGLNTAKSTVSNVLGSIKDKFTNIFDIVKNTVKNAIDKIKSYFNFEWSLPHLKLPHFSISGSFSLNPPSVPSFGVDWYKKAMDDPMLMTRPTAFGMNSKGQIMAGGEAGDEVVSGKDTLMTMISDAVEEKNSSMIEVLMKILEAILMLDENMGGNLREALEGTAFKVNNREFARLVKAVN